MKKSEKALEVFERLKVRFPDAHCELVHSNPYELLIATILSAQCTDVRVNMVTPALFKKYPTPQKLARARLEDVEEAIKSINFFRNKSKSLIGAAKGLVENHHGEVPKTVEELSDLPGVGRKTANVVLGNAFNINTGFVVDTHVKRTAHMIGLTNQVDPAKVEIDMMKLLPNEAWTLMPHLLIFLGRQICVARRPQCDLCVLKDICNFAQTHSRAPRKAPRDTKSKAAGKASSRP